MCGIVGYIGPADAVPIIIDGLRRLEYRGYDSAGIAVGNGTDQVSVRRAAGKLRNLEEVVRLHPIHGAYGIGHTRWATHGGPTEENAHPHRDASGQIVVVHNGIIENYLDLKEELEAEGHRFQTETDSEIIAHLIEKNSREDPTLELAVQKTILRLQGLFALAAISMRDPRKIVVARRGPPAVVGLGEGEYFVASDVPAILHHTHDIFFLMDGDIAVLSPRGVRMLDFEGHPVTRPVQRVLWDPVMAEKGGFKHFMLKEMFEQPRAVRDTIVGRVSRTAGKILLHEVEIESEELAAVEQVKIVACGTSWHAALAGKFMIERLARLPVDVDYGSEFRYRDPILPPHTLTVAVSQSGETADTLAALREAKQKDSRTLAICNVFGAMLTREADGTIYTHAGPEIGVASTKAFTAQLTALFLLAMHLGQTHGKLGEEDSLELVQELIGLPAKLESVLGLDARCEELARDLYRAEDFLFLGRGIHYPVALEGALKLKEISYIHAEGYPAGEMKHGPNALIDEDLPVVIIATKDPNDPESAIRYEKTLANLKEVEARQGNVIALINEGDKTVRKIAKDVIEIPSTCELLSPILEIVPLQLLAYHIAVRLGCDVDQPRNLAKSVTVE